MLTFCCTLASGYFDTKKVILIQQTPGYSKFLGKIGTSSNKWGFE